MADEQAQRDDNHVTALLAKDDSTGETKALLADSVTGRLLVNSTGGGAGTQYTDGDTDATPTGTMGMGFDGTDTVYAQLVDSDGHLQVDVLSGGGGGTLVQDGDAVNAANTAVITVGSDGSNYQIPATDASGNLQVDVLASALPAGAATSANQLADGHNVTVDNAAGAAAVNIQDGGNTITVDGTVTANAGTNLNTSALATSANQLADGHNVTVDNISTDEVYVRGSQAAGSPVDNEVVTVQGIASMTPLAVTESSPISGFATSAKQLADGHNVTVDNGAAGAAVNIQDGGNVISVDDGASSLTVDTTGTSGLEVVQGTAADLNVTEASAADILTAVQILDDWDESDRAKVNLIVGQAGIAAGTGGDGVTVPRVTLATDVALPAGTNAIGKLAANSGVDIGDVDVTSLPVSSTSAVTTVAGSASSVTLLSAAATRLGASIHNDSTAALYVKFGTTASTSSFTIKLAQDDYYEVFAGYTGRIDGIWDSATGNARITELTP